MGKQGKKKGARMINNIKKYIELGLSSRQTPMGGLNQAICGRANQAI